MNDNLEDTVLDDGNDVQNDTAVTTGSDSTDAVTPATATPDASPVAVVRKKAGRKVDTTGKTALGSARLLYAANPHLDTTALKALFLAELGPKFGTEAGTAQTYVSYVRKKDSKAA